jgi:hypothetical protein
VSIGALIISGVNGDAAPAPERIPREPLFGRLRRTAGLQIIVVGVLFGLALLHFSTNRQPSATLEGVVPTNARLITQQTFGVAHALLIERRGSFQLLMAYKDRDGWIGLPVVQPLHPGDYAVAKSIGHPPIPAFTAVYGELRGAADTRSVVRVRWGDQTQDVPLVDGAFLVLREGRFHVTQVSLVEPGAEERPLLASR